LNAWLGVKVRTPQSMELLIEELPGIRSVESTNFDGCDKFGIEIA
jgi:hypothetical protein